MFISKYSAEEYYKAVDGPKEHHWYFTNHEFNDAQSVTTVVNGSRKNWGCTEGRRRYIALEVAGK